MKTATDRLLDAARAARAATPDVPTGIARSGSAVVTYYRASKPARYEVGTDAIIAARGQRGHVTPYVDALLAGCCTAPDCEQWIAKRAAGAVGQ